LCCDVEAPRAGRLPGRLVEENVEETGAVRWVELEPVTADTGEKVEINGGKLNVPGEDTEPATDTSELAIEETTAEVGLDCDGTTAFNATVETEEFEACKLGAFTWIEDKIMGNELPIARTTASAIESADKDEVELAAVLATTTEASDDCGETGPAAKPRREKKDTPKTGGESCER